MSDAHDLWGYVIRSPENCVGLLVGFGKDFRYTKVSNFYIVVFCKEHVSCLQISVRGEVEERGEKRGKREGRRGERGEG